MRVLQGLALGGEYGGAATYIAEHAPDGRRGFYTRWIQTTATMGIVPALLVILVCRLGFGDQAFGDWGWRVPFLISAVLVVLSIYIRLKLEESPLYARLKAQGKASHNPALESFQRQELGPDPARAVRRDRARRRGLVHGPVLRAVLSDDRAEGRLHRGLHHHDHRATAAAPFFIVFGALSDRVGRRNIMTPASCSRSSPTGRYSPGWRHSRTVRSS